MMSSYRSCLLSARKKCLRLTKPATTRSVSDQPKTGVVMLNMGGPKTLDQVHDFLYAIASDRDMIRLPFLQDTIASFIAKIRTPHVQEKYRQIGGGSPILDWTHKQGRLLCHQLDKQSPSTAPHKHYVAFRCCKPTTEDAFAELEHDGVKRAVIFSQFPHYSCATSGSSLNAIHRLYQKRPLPKGLKLSVIDRWSTHPLLAKTIAHLIKTELKQLPEAQRKDAVVLFSAHSLPLRVVQRGDHYPFEIGATVQLVMEELGNCNPHQLVWQSKVGPLPWLKPYTHEALVDYVAQGKKSFVLVPISFVNEHIETLHEMDIGYCKELARRIGVEAIRRVSAPNDHPLFIDALTSLVKTHLESGGGVGRTFLNRCPGCVSQGCVESKKWFSEVCSS